MQHYYNYIYSWIFLFRNRYFFLQLFNNEKKLCAKFTHCQKWQIWLIFKIIAAISFWHSIRFYFEIVVKIQLNNTENSNGYFYKVLNQLLLSTFEILVFQLL